MEPGYQTRPFPRSRQLVIDSARMGHRKHIIRGLVEFDVTRPRQLIHEYKEQTGEALSFTAFLIACPTTPSTSSSVVSLKNPAW